MHIRDANRGGCSVAERANTAGRKIQPLSDEKPVRIQEAIDVGDLGPPRGVSQLGRCDRDERISGLYDVLVHLPTSVTPTLAILPMREQRIDYAFNTSVSHAERGSVVSENVATVVREI
jgi:hypothetical protein